MLSTVEPDPGNAGEGSKHTATRVPFFAMREEHTAMSTINKRWRVVDIVTAAVLGVAVGLIFLVWNVIGGLGLQIFDNITPGLGGLASGGWLIGGVLGGLIIRKPGAAIFVEVLAATVSASVGNQWGISVLYAGIAQGIGAELIFLALGYAVYGMKGAVFSGIGAGLGLVVLSLFTSANLAKSLEYNLIYLSCTVLSGAVVAGLGGWALVKGLAKTGALDRFASGREHRELV